MVDERRRWPAWWWGYAAGDDDDDQPLDQACRHALMNVGIVDDDLLALLYDLFMTWFAEDDDTPEAAEAHAMLIVVTDVAIAEQDRRNGVLQPRS